MTRRGGDYGGRRPRILVEQVAKTFSLEARDVAKIKAYAYSLGCSDSEALRRLLATVVVPMETPQCPT